MKISVCMATYNGQSHIADQLRSIITQLGNDDEIIISDDSSTDDTLKIVNSFNDKRISVYKNESRNLIKNFENAIKHAQGEIIFLADQDDVWLPGRVDEIVNALLTVDLVLTNAHIVDNELNKTGKTLFETLDSSSGIVKNLIKNTYVGCCMAFNARIKKKILPFPVNLPIHDQWIGLVAEIFYKVKFISNPSVLYRRHGANVSNTGNISTNSFSVKLKNRILIFKALALCTIKR